MTDTAEIDVILCETPDELHCHYQGELNAQGAFIALDMDKARLKADYNAEIGNAIPMTVYHGQTRRYAIPVLTADAANWLLTEIRPLAQRILHDWEDEWDGSNYKAKLGADACRAEAEIQKLTDSERFDMSDLVAEYDASDWMQYSNDGELAAEHGITAETPDARLAEIAAKITRDEAQSGDYGYVVIDGMEGYLRDLRDRLREDSSEDA